MKGLARYEATNACYPSSFGSDNRLDTTDDFFVGSGTCCHCFDFGHLDYN